jgi:hypothetical protein
MKLTPDDEVTFKGVALYERLDDENRPHAIQQDIDEVILSNAEALALAAQLPEVRALVEKAQRLSAEAKYPYLLNGEPQPEFIIDPQTLAELDTALAPFKDLINV